MGYSCRRKGCREHCRRFRKSASTGRGRCPEGRGPRGAPAPGHRAPAGGAGRHRVPAAHEVLRVLQGIDLGGAARGHASECIRATADVPDALLPAQFRQSKRLMQEMLSTILGIRISLGAISKLEGKVSAALEKPVEEAKAYVREQAV